MIRWPGRAPERLGHRDQLHHPAGNRGLRRNRGRARHQHPHRAPGRAGPRRCRGRPCSRVYWSRTDEWFLVPNGTRGARLPRRRALRRRSSSSSGSAPRRVRVLRRGRSRRRQAARDRADHELLPRRRRRVRRRAGAVRAGSGSRPRAAPSARLRSAWTSSAFGGVMESAGVPALKRALLVGGRAAAVRRPLHRQAAVRRLLDRHRGRRGLGDRGRAARDVPGPARGCGRRAEPAGPLRPQRLGPHGADPGRLRDREAAAPRRRRDLLLRREVPPSRGPLRRAPRVPRRHLARAARHHPVRWPAASSS